MRPREMRLWQGLLLLLPLLAGPGCRQVFGIDSRLACPPNEVPCGSVCVDLTRDNANCGTCGVVCQGTSTCVGSSCSPPATDAGVDVLGDAAKDATSDTAADATQDTASDAQRDTAPPSDVGPVDTNPPNDTNTCHTTCSGCCNGTSCVTTAESVHQCGTGGETCATCNIGVDYCASGSCNPDLEWSRWASADVGSFSTGDPDVTTDSKTGLMWQRNHHTTALLWSNAVSYCNNLSLGGHSDWRLPTRVELLSIVDHTIFNPTINLTVFPGTPYAPDDSDPFWTSTTRVVDASTANQVIFYEGIFSDDGKATSSSWVRCVRDAAQTGTLIPATPASGAPPERYTTATNTVADRTTGLMWQRADSGGTAYTFANAGPHCTSLTVGGYNDWRLPTVKELFSLVDSRVESPAIDATAFPGTTATNMWTTTPFQLSEGHWTVSFNGGGYIWGHPDSTVNPVRCVRKP
jgi:hypothetical protein